MARTIRHTPLETRTARGRLKARGKPYFCPLEPGLHLGYRKAKGRNGAPSVAGKWIARHYVGKQAYVFQKIGTADDYSDADGVAVLSFKQAQSKAREGMVRRAEAEAGVAGPLTVRAAMDAYVEFLATNRKSASDARYRVDAFINPTLGDIEVATLSADRLRRWHVDLAKAAPRLRTKKGKKQNVREVESTDDAQRRRRSTANRTLTVLKAALNRAWREGKVKSDDAWRRVEPFESVDAARVRYLNVREALRLINGSAGDFRDLVEAALQTGARYGELAQLAVGDFNPDAGTLAIRQSKSGRPRHVVLTEEGGAVFKRLAAGRRASEPMLRKSDGSTWQKSHQARPMTEACERAKIDPPISFHGLRHTWASLSVMAGVPLLVVAKNLGHADTRMVERHYGHLAPSYVTDAIRAGAPRFGATPPGNVVSIQR